MESVEWLEDEGCFEDVGQSDVRTIGKLHWWLLGTGVEMWSGLSGLRISKERCCGQSPEWRFQVSC
jgi:hypothetical protein